MDEDQNTYEDLDEANEMFGGDGMPEQQGTAPEAYVPPVLKMIPRSSWPKNACTGCRHSLWHAFATNKPGVFQLKCFCGAMHFKSYDSHDAGAKAVVACDGAAEKA